MCLTLIGGMTGLAVSSAFKEDRSVEWAAAAVGGCYWDTVLLLVQIIRVRSSLQRAVSAARVPYPVSSWSWQTHLQFVLLAAPWLPVVAAIVLVAVIGKAGAAVVLGLIALALLVQLSARALRQPATDPGSSVAAEGKSQSEVVARPERAERRPAVSESRRMENEGVGSQITCPCPGKSAPEEKLLRLCKGDSQLFDRLIRHESKLNPQLNRMELVQRAISALERDNL
jgi:hypothetical protein